MKALLDECVPAKFGKLLSGHDCITVPSAGFAGMKNGELLTLAEQLGFEVFLTIDQGIAHQQQFADRVIAVLVLRPRTSRLADLLPLLPECLAQLRSLAPGELRIVGG